MGVIDDCIKNVELSLTELKSALQAEQMIEPESVTNQQEQFTDEQLLAITNIRF